MNELGLDFGNSVSLAAVVAYILQKMKVSPWRVFRKFSKDHPGVLRTAAAVAAMGTAAGFSWGFEDGKFWLDGITLGNLITLIGVGFQQFVGQELIFRIHKAGSMKLINQPPVTGTGVG